MYNEVSVNAFVDALIVRLNSNPMMVVQAVDYNIVDGTEVHMVINYTRQMHPNARGFHVLTESYTLYYNPRTKEYMYKTSITRALRFNSEDDIIFMENN